ncbi:MAG: isoleucine--tRNA ligase [Deltaproteobacteria bacterium]|nr:isoleucine--tRNA ligase [Deltaproteobacteria bacterium]
MLSDFNSKIDFVDSEHEVLDFWQKNKIFQRSVSERDPQKQYVFYDGPPFATGLPHYGHLLQSVVKDVIPRYWTMCGFRVERRFGWDCHGLPVEYEIDKSLGLEGRKAIEDYGIAEYNEACRSIVLNYTKEWEKTVTRLGRWVDFKHDYKTMELSYMESVWWVVKSIWDKGLIYEGYKVMPYSTACATPLSNFEANMDYREVQDPSLTLLFKKKDEENTFFVAWTTTPWTLPSNLALAVHPDEEYVKIFDKEQSKNFILACKRLAAYYQNPDQYEEKEKFKGKNFLNQKYEPLFPYFKDQPNSFRIIGAEFVTMEDGTGVVHIAPGFGEDDYAVCKKENIEVVCPVDADGKFTSEVKDFKGLHVKATDKKIIQRLKEEGKILKHETIQHSYPFCWRSETPLIYRAVSSWFVNVEKIKDDILESNQNTNWVPQHIKEGRFGKWLEGARDWAISRNRFWGCPIPIWKNEVSGKTICLGSAAELEKLGGKKLKDLHKHFIDDITFELPGEKGKYKRIEQVLDCWFESGSMPYAQAHYPFENKETFEKNFPADFIGEGLDQTRGWFYTLTVLGTILFKKSPFKNVIVTGMILAEDGKKMSKRLKNYPDPHGILEKYGADALRLDLINSPVVRAEELRFTEKSVEDIVRRVLLKWWNSYSFFMSYAVIENFEPQGTFSESENILDKWVLSRLQSLIKRTHQEMKAYKLYNVVPALLDFIEELTNTYIRFNRKRFWVEGESKDKILAFETLYEVLLQFTKIMAPFTPFLSEKTYQELLKNSAHRKDSVHLESYPQVDEKLIHLDLEDAVRRMENIVVMGRNVREKMGAKVKIPLNKLTIIHRNKKVLDQFKVLEATIQIELNVRKIEYDQNEGAYVKLQAKPNHKVLGPRFGNRMKDIVAAIQKLKEEDILKLEDQGEVTLLGEKLTGEDIQVLRLQQKGHENVASSPSITIEFDLTINEDQVLEGKSREIINRIQKMRKNANFNLDDRIVVQFQCDNTLSKVIDLHKDYIASQVLAQKLEKSSKLKGKYQEEHNIDGDSIKIAITVTDSGGCFNINPEGKKC